MLAYLLTTPTGLLVNFLILGLEKVEIEQDGVKTKTDKGYAVTTIGRKGVIGRATFVKEKNANAFMHTIKSEIEENLKKVR